MIDKNPKVGRIAVRHDDRYDHHADLSSIGRITEISGKRIRYDRRADPLNPSKAESRFLLDKTLLCVCDTEEELAHIVGFEQELARVFADVNAGIERSWNALIERFK